MRNEIYRLCLVNDEAEAQVTKALKTPQSLSTCRQIRNEASPIWYYENEFEIWLIDCDMALYQAYINKVVAPLEVNFDPKWVLTVRISGRYNWANLMEWCRSVWNGKLASPSDHDDMADDWTVILAATNIAEESQALPWEAVVRQLERLRMVAGRLNEE
jgi:hypothetical protein